MIMLKFFDWWEDEFPVEGFQLFEDEEAVDEYICAAKNKFEENGQIIFSFGTNEELKWENIAEFLACFEKIKVPKTADPFIRKTFPNFGIFPTLE